ncbi:uncharacterized protein F4812DRAFT_444048 [Daldinia caldariorum]|uniref:uncharacterized protein n=1 Tax=Daldinia caldariorum TaxID=326644 RepID=UPI0020072294|nr:uncharacterized protein F4812DRAFT_444048 [Daldinia caldariorum]KAI1464277.1 hypothetical protein F4812DRAFT_444048 [Daldinia caldariorum]
MGGSVRRCRLRHSLHLAGLVGLAFTAMGDGFVSLNQLQIGKRARGQAVQIQMALGPFLLQFPRLKTPLSQFQHSKQGRVVTGPA